MGPQYAAEPVLRVIVPEPGDVEVTVSIYDGFNRLVKVENEAGISYYGYRPDGLHAYKDVNGQRLDQIWAGQVLVMEVAHGSGAVLRSYVRGIGLLSMQERAGKSYYLFNAHGDIVALTDNQGVVMLTGLKVSSALVFMDFSVSVLAIL